MDGEGDWPAVEESLGTPLPQDYKSFIAVYGTGSINGFLTIFSPFAQDEDLNLFHQIEASRREWELIRADFYNRVPDREEDPMRYSVFPPLGGFLPWGRAPNAPWGDPYPTPATRSSGVTG